MLQNEHYLKNKRNNGNELFRNFCNKLINIIDKNVPVKTASRQEQKLANKPRLTKELLKQIRIKNTLLKQFIKNQIEECHKHYNTYCSQLNILIEQFKVLFYQNLVDENNSNSI